MKSVYSDSVIIDWSWQANDRDATDRIHMGCGGHLAMSSMISAYHEAKYLDGKFSVVSRGGIIALCYKCGQRGPGRRMQRTPWLHLDRS